MNKTIATAWFQAVFTTIIVGMIALSRALALPTGTSSLQVDVIDASTRKPLSLVNVSVIGPVVRIGFTDAHGTVRFENLLPGNYYVRLAKLQYKSSTLPNLLISDGADSNITMSMSKVLKTIGAVTVKASPNISGSHIGDTSPERTVSGSLISALELNPFINSAAGAGNSQQVSVDGHPPGATGLFVDGAPAAPIGVPANLRSVNTELFDSAEILRDAPGLSGGAFNLHIPDPTLAPSYLLEGAYNSFDRSRDAIWVRGTIGRLGYSLAGGSSGYNDLLNGMRYMDSSGLDYVHDASSIARTAAVKLRYPLSQGDIVLANIVASDGRAADYCRQFSANMPCGYGPGNYTSDRLRTLQLRDILMLGAVSTSLQFFSTNERIEDNQRNRYVNNIATPVLAQFTARTTGFSLMLSSSIGRRSTLSTNFLSQHTSFSGSTIAGTISAGSPTQNFAFNAANLAAAIHLSPMASLALQGGLSAATGSGTTANGLAAVTLEPTRVDRINVAYSAGNLQMPQVVSNGISDAGSLQFNCQANVAYGYGPGRSAPGSDSSVARLSWLHRFVNAQLLFTLQRTVVRDDLITAYVNGQAFSDSTFPPGYFATASSLYASPLQCGRHLAIGPQNVYYLTPFDVTTRYDNESVLTKIALGHGFIAMPYYVTSAATALAAATGAPSGTGLVAGSQLPNVPLHKYGMTLDWKAPRSALETVINVTHVSTNNANNLPRYTIFSAGTIFPLEQGNLTVSVTNLFNQFSGVFVSPQNAVPLMTSRGAPIPVLATPLEPRSFHIEYRVQIGQPEFRPAPRDLESELGADTSASFSLEPFPAQSPANAFELATNNPSCGPEDASIARQLLEALSGYVTAGNFVDSKTIPFGVEVRHHVTAGGYVLLVGGGARGAMTALFACANIHGGSNSDVRARGLYVPSLEESRKFDLLFDPRVGFYITNFFATNPVELRLRPLPDVPPADPFSVSSASCPSELKNAAALTLSSLRRYFANVASGQSETAPQGISIVEHHDPNQWFEMRFSDPQLSSAVLQCAAVAAGTLEQLRKFGVSGVRTPNLGYAAPLGLYVRSD